MKGPKMPKSMPMKMQKMEKMEKPPDHGKEAARLMKQMGGMMDKPMKKMGKGGM